MNGNTEAGQRQPPPGRDGAVKVLHPTLGPETTCGRAGPSLCARHRPHRGGGMGWKEESSGAVHPPPVSRGRRGGGGRRQPWRRVEYRMGDGSLGTGLPETP